MSWSRADKALAHTFFLQRETDLLLEARPCRIISMRRTRQRNESSSRILRQEPQYCWVLYLFGIELFR